MSASNQKNFINETFNLLGIKKENFSQLEQLLQEDSNCKSLFCGNKSPKEQQIIKRKLLLQFAKLLDTTSKDETFFLSEVIKEFCGVDIIPFSQMPTNSQLLLAQAMTEAQKTIQNNPFNTARPNEAGICFEQILEKELANLGIFAQRDAGYSKMGYPDLQVVIPETGETAYLECKTHDQKNLNSSLRTFYLSPTSVQKKVIRNGYHLLCALTLERVVQNNKIAYSAANDIPVLKDISLLPVKIKYEYNAGNKELYSS